MASFLDDLLDDLGEDPKNEQADEVATDADEYQADEVEETNEADDGVTEEVSEVDEEAEASATDEAEDDDDAELTPVEKKAYGRLKALQDEREKRRSADEARKAAEAERDRLNAQLADMQRQQAQAAAQNLPNPHDDPEGYRTAIENHYRVEMTKQQLGFSIQNAVAKYGETEVQTAAQWFEDQMAANPHMPLRENMLSQSDQMEYVVSQYKQATKMQALASGDVSALVAELQKAGYIINKAETTTATETAAVTPAAPAPIAKAPALTPAAPKRSKLASATGATLATPATRSMLDIVTRR